MLPFTALLGSCRMIDVGKRLEQLNLEIAGLTAEEQAAEMSWLSATDPQQKRDLKEVYEAAKEELKSRCQSRDHLTPFGAGEVAV